MTQAALSSKQYEANDAFEAVEMYFQKGWTDGLPVVPPTEAKVREFIAVTGRDSAEVLYHVPVRRRAVTIEKVAINAVMAGCLPEYMPVVLAAVEAMGEDTYNLHGSATSTGGAATLLIVNGPVAKKLSINSGANIFGPGFRANATIGRALRLFLINVCGTVPGTLDRSSVGHPGKYTYCIAEDETNSPWGPYRVEKGFAADASTVTVLPMLAPRQVRDSTSNTAETLLTSFAAAVAAMGEYSAANRFGLKYCTVVINDEHRKIIAREGWSKPQVKDFLFQKSQRSVADLKRWGLLHGNVAPGDNEKVISAVSTADEIMVIAAGGGGVFSACIAPWGGGLSSAPTTRAIASPGY